MDTVKKRDDHVTLTINQVEIATSRSLLIENSDYFRAMLDGGFRESRQDSIELKNVRFKARTFRILLNFLEKSELDFDENSFQEIFNMAMFLQFSSIIEELKRRITMENWPMYLLFAETFGHIFLEKYCYQFLSDRYRWICGSEDFENLTDDAKVAIKELPYRCKNVILILRINNHISSNLSEKEKCYPRIYFLVETSGKWHALTSLPTVVSAANKVIICGMHDCLYVLIGQCSDNNCKQLWRYRTKTDEWVEVSLPESLDIRGPAYLQHADDRLYILGIKSFMSYDPKSDTWSKLSHHWRVFTNPITISGHMYTYSHSDRCLYVYDWKDDSWTTCAIDLNITPGSGLPQQFMFSEIDTFDDDHIVMIIKPLGQGRIIFVLFDITSGKLSLLSTLRAHSFGLESRSVPFPLFEAEVVRIDDIFYVIGQRSVFSYCLKSNQWDRIAKLPDDGSGCDLARCVAPLYSSKIQIPDILLN